MDTTEQEVWIDDISSRQPKDGIYHKDTVLLENIEHFGPVRYSLLKLKFEQMGTDNMWTPTNDEPLVDQLSGLCKQKDKELFLNVVQTTLIGPIIANNLYITIQNQIDGEIDHTDTKHQSLDDF